MGKHYIFSDTHHGSGKVVNHLQKQAKKVGGKIDVSSTGDFLVYAANAKAPKELSHEWSKAYKRGDKDGMARHQEGWVRDIVIPGTQKSGKKFQELKGQLKGGRINAIMGNSDYLVGSLTQKYVGEDVRELLGGRDSSVYNMPDIKVKKQDNTTLVYLPHDIKLLSKYKGKDAKAAQAALAQDKVYQKRIKRVAQQIKKYDSNNVVVLMHEAPKPERWYGKGTDKSKQRLPDPLKAHYDSVLEQVVSSARGKKINIFHGHLHEGNKKRYQYHGIKARLLDIDDVVAYDTLKGTYRTRRAA